MYGLRTGSIYTTHVNGRGRTEVIGALRALPSTSGTVPSYVGHVQLSTARWSDICTADEAVDDEAGSSAVRHPTERRVAPRAHITLSLAGFSISHVDRILYGTEAVLGDVWRPLE